MPSRSEIVPTPSASGKTVLSTLLRKFGGSSGVPASSVSTAPIYPSPTQTDMSFWSEVRRLAIRCKKRNERISSFAEREFEGRRYWQKKAIEAAREFEAASSKLSSSFQPPIGELPSEEDYQRVMSSPSIQQVDGFYNGYDSAIAFAELIATTTKGPKPVSNLELISRMQNGAGKPFTNSKLVLQALRDHQSQLDKGAKTAESIGSFQAGESQECLSASTVVNIVHDEDDPSNA